MESIARKWCPRCQQSRHLDQFNADRSTKDGLCVYCRKCRKDYAHKRHKDTYIKKGHFQDNVPVECKKCHACKVIKALDGFAHCGYTPDGRRGSCKKCENHHRRMLRAADLETARQKQKEERERRMSENPEKIHQMWRRAYLKRHYGLTIEEYDRMMASQGDVCAICGCPEEKMTASMKKRKISVDHCHKTGKIRGLLCSHCNSGIGYFKDNPAILQKAIEYLQKAQGDDN